MYSGNILYSYLLMCSASSDSSVSIATGIWTERPRNRVPITLEVRQFSLLRHIETGSGAQPASSLRYQGTNPTTHLHQVTRLNCVSTPLYVFIAWCLGIYMCYTLYFRSLCFSNFWIFMVIYLYDYCTRRSSRSCVMSKMVILYCSILLHFSLGVD
jgi:hypothetical protein